MVSFCWNDSNDKKEIVSDSAPRLLVATKDERVWSLTVLKEPGSEGLKQTNYKKNIEEEKDEDLRAVIKIEDDDEENSKIEEIELWNDEDGMLEDSFDPSQEDTQPPPKRQKIESPSPQLSQRPVFKTESNVEIVNVDASKDLVDSEVSMLANIKERITILSTPRPLPLSKAIN